MAKGAHITQVRANSVGLEYITDFSTAGRSYSRCVETLNLILLKIIPSSVFSLQALHLTCVVSAFTSFSNLGRVMRSPAAASPFPHFAGAVLPWHLFS